jgi:hypothetical protein
LIHIGLADYLSQAYLTHKFFYERSNIDEGESEWTAIRVLDATYAGTGPTLSFSLSLSSKKGYTMLYSQQMPFYLCKDHEYVYKKMQQNIDMKNYFPETIRENQ